jgi:6-phosphogluconolactonase (cycloisomerase 2 family)
MSPLNMVLSPSGDTLFVTGQVLQSEGTIESFPISNGVLGVPVLSTTGNTPYGLTIDSGGSHLYTGNKIDNSISAFTINADRSLTLISTTGETGSSSGPVSLFIDKSGKYLYVANAQSSGQLGAFSIGSDGGLTLLTNSPFATGAEPIIVTGDSSGKYLFVGNQSSSALQSFSLDASTGTLTSVASYTAPGTVTSIVITP